MTMRSASWIALTTAALVLAACEAAPAETGETRSDAATVPTGARPTLPLDANGCIDLTAHRPRPIPLRGKLVVTYVEPTLQNMCEWDEAARSYWCRSATRESEACADVSGAFWCPVANPPPERLGDPQELASFDLENPGAGVRRWTNDVLHEAELDISEDGKKVVYAVRKKLDAFDDGLGIWVADADGRNAKKVVDRAGHTGIPTWLPPDAERFLFLADGLHVFDTTTAKATDVAIAGFDRRLVIDPGIAHDGKKVTFKADEQGGNRPSVYVMDFDGRAGSQVKRLTRGFSDHDPVFSKDDRKILFERFYGKGDWDAFEDRLGNPEANKWGIVEVDVATGEERVLVPHDACGRHFFWLPTISPDGAHVMFVHDYVAEDGYQDLWVADIDGGDAQPVPGTKGFHWFDWTR